MWAYSQHVSLLACELTRMWAYSQHVSLLACELTRMWAYLHVSLLACELTRRETKVKILKSKSLYKTKCSRSKSKKWRFKIPNSAARFQSWRFFVLRILYSYLWRFLIKSGTVVSHMRATSAWKLFSSPSLTTRLKRIPDRDEKLADTNSWVQTGLYCYC